MGLSSVKWWQRVLAAFLIVPLLFMNVSCTAYTLRQSTIVHPLPVDKSNNIVLHQGGRSVKLDSFELEGWELRGFSTSELQFIDEPTKETFSSRIAHEVHLYLDETPPLVVEPGKPIVVPLSSINKVMVYEVNKAGTVFCWGLSGVAVGYLLFQVFIIILIIALIA